MASRDELACSYAALILTDDDIEVTGDKINALLTAAGVKVEPYWPDMFAGLCEKISVKDMLTAVSAGAGAGAAAPAAGGAAAGGAAEAKAAEPEEESDEELGLSLFD